MELFSVIPQDLGKTSSPTFAGLTITGSSVLGLNSAVFKPAAGGDSTTFFQIKNAAGTQVMGFDTSNGRMIIGAGVPNADLVVAGGGFHLGVDGVVDSNFRVYSDVLGAWFEIDNHGNFGGINCNGIYNMQFSNYYNNNGFITFHTVLGGGLSKERFRITNYGFIGTNEPFPETLFEMTHAQPYLTLHNDTHENTDGGRESRLIFKGEQGVTPFAETELAMLEVSHDGTGNDQLGKIVLSVNTGAELVEALRIDSLLRFGIATTPTARLHLPAGVATAGLAPLKFTSGTDLTTPEAGVIEYDGSHFSVTEVVDRRVLSVASDSITTAVTVADTVTETTVFTAPISADELHAGKVFRIYGFGQASTHDAADTLTIRIKIGGTLLTSLGAIPGQAADDPFHFHNVITIRTTGEGGTIASHGHIMIKDTEVHQNDQNVEVNTEVAENITVTLQWNDANAGNTATLDQCFLEVLV